MAPTIWQRIAPEVPRLLQMAGAGADPETIANMVADLLAEPDLDAIGDLIEADDWPETWFRSFPQTVPHREWFGSFFDTLAGRIFEDDGLPDAEQAAPPGDPVGGPGNAAHPGRDEKEGSGSLAGSGDPPVGAGSHPEGADTAG